MIIIFFGARSSFSFCLCFYSSRCHWETKRKSTLLWPGVTTVTSMNNTCDLKHHWPQNTKVITKGQQDTTMTRKIPNSNPPLTPFPLPALLKKSWVILTKGHSSMTCKWRKSDLEWPSGAKIALQTGRLRDHSHMGQEPWTLNFAFNDHEWNSEVGCELRGGRGGKVGRGGEEGEVR